MAASCAEILRREFPELDGEMFDYVTGEAGGRPGLAWRGAGPDPSRPSRTGEAPSIPRQVADWRPPVPVSTLKRKLASARSVALSVRPSVCQPARDGRGRSKIGSCPPFLEYMCALFAGQHAPLSFLICFKSCPSVIDPKARFKLIVGFPPLP